MDATVEVGYYYFRSLLRSGHVYSDFIKVLSVNMDTDSIEISVNGSGRLIVTNY